MTQTMTPAEIAAMRADAEAGTPRASASEVTKNMGIYTDEQASADTRRRRRIPAMEAHIIAQEDEIARLRGEVWLRVGEYLAGQPDTEVSKAARKGIERAIRNALNGETP